MKQKIKYTDEPIQLGNTVNDFLPLPEEFDAKDRTVRVTINLNEDIINFFKEEANKSGIPYQRLIRNVVDLYVQDHTQ
ncbi:MAG: CopG family transcriptional regulator [SAR324 cluster bacterium]|nr:CopG family transcriptional regulator [SAR324 cluster bacterium]